MTRSFVQRARRCGALLLLGAAAAGAQPTAELPSPDASGLTLGVAPFEAHMPPGAVVPDLASLLAQRLATLGVARVVGPAQLGASAEAEPTPETVRGWAAAADVDAVVLGRTTRIGDALSVDLWLREGGSGEVAGTYVQEIARPDALEPALESLAGRVVEGAAGLGRAAPAAEAPPLQVAAVAPAAAPAPTPRAARGDAPFGFQAWNSDAPLAIASDELEAVQQDGRRRLVFKRNVRVQQGDLSMECARLEAFYPPDQNQPNRLVASGQVQLAQGKQKARCDEATYDRTGERLVCSGNAYFQDGDNQLSGETIDIDLREERVVVKGGASVLIHPEERKKPEQRRPPRKPPEDAE